VIVRDLGDSWQVVLQINHADLSGDFARAWAERGGRHDSLTLAAARHDDGWAVWERSPLVDESGKPINFFDVSVHSHLAFYRACVAAVTEEDPYAGLLISMHGAGIYRQRYGLDPALPLLTEAHAHKATVDAFVEEQESGYADRIAAIGAEEEERWRDFGLLELYDRLSLYFAMKDVEAGESAELQGYRLEPVAPWRVRMDPFPFAESAARFTMLRRLVPKNGRPDVLAVEPEPVELVIEA
jgi:Protein of unknown function (DUF3891)